MKYVIEPVTCKEFVAVNKPELLSATAFAGVIGCPHNIGLKSDLSACALRRTEGRFEEYCIRCWNQNAKHHGKWIMKVKVLK